MDHVVKFRLVHFYVDTTNPQTGEKHRTERTASHGQRLHSEDGTNTEKDIFNVPQDQLDWLAGIGAFFSPHEVTAMENGVSDRLTVVESTDSLDGPRGDTDSSGLSESDFAGLHGGEGIHPLTFTEMSGWQIEEYLRSAQPTPEEIIEAVRNEQTPEARAALLSKFIDAENIVTGGEPREELIQLAAAEAGVAAQGPSGSGGIPETLPEGNGGDPDGESGGNGGSGADDAPPASDAAKALAAEKGVDLRDVPFEGEKITQPDVQAYLKEHEGQ